MRTRLTAIILAVLMCFGLLAGCQSSELHSYSADSEEKGGTAASSGTSVPKMDYTACYESYDPNEVMLTVNGMNITWSELFYWYTFDLSNIESYGGSVSDWDANCSVASGKTNREYVMDNALETIKNYCALESKAKEMGITLTADDQKQLQTIWDNNVKSYGNGDAELYIEYLQKKQYLSKDLYDKMNEINLLYNRMRDTMFGENGEKISQSDILEKAADMGYIRVKHIFLSTKDDTSETLPDEQLAQKKATAQNILSELKGISDKAQLEKRFDALISQYGEDPGTDYYPDGDTFISGKGTMDTAFENAASELSEYGLSDVVSSSNGYFIILRLPLSTTATVEYTDDNAKTTLGCYVAQNMFSAESDSWTDESTVEYTDAYKNMDIAKVFEKAVPEAESSGN